MVEGFKQLSKHLFRRGRVRQFAVIGLGKFGSKVARTLSEEGGEVLAIDNDPALVEEIKDDVTQAVCLDSTDEEALRAVGVPEVDVAVVSFGDNVEKNILTTALLKRIGIKTIIARANDHLQGQVLESVGATRVVYPEEDMALRVANAIITPQVLDHIDLNGGFELMEFIAPAAFVGRTVREIGFRENFGVNVILIQKHLPGSEEGEEKEEEATVNQLPMPDYVIEENDVLLVVGKGEDIERLRNQ